MPEFQEAARKYIDQGWSVLPLHHGINGECSCGLITCTSMGKHPRTRYGVKDASFDLAVVNNWAQQFPMANLGIATGSDSKLIVFDIDPRHGGNESLLKLGKYPKTLEVQTGGNGKHIYFKHPGFKIKNRVNWHPGIDIRSDNGYVVAPPSVHASGNKYHWLCGKEDKLAEAPEKWLETTAPEKQIYPGKSIPEGQRNDFLASLAGFLKAKGFKDQTTLIDMLTPYNSRFCHPPLPPQEVIRIAESISRYPDRPFVTNVELTKGDKNFASLPWSTPKDLPQTDAQAPSLERDQVPPGIRDWIEDIAERIQVPLEFVCVPALVMFSAAIGRSVVIHPKKEDKWTVIPNLWGGLIARPGFFKSPCIAEALSPLHAIADEAWQEYEGAYTSAKARVDVLKAQINGLAEKIQQKAKKGQIDDVDEIGKQIVELRNKIKAETPTANRFITNDTTIEKLAMIFNENPRGILLMRDELSGWLASLDKYGREGDREFYLESWNGFGSFTIDRVGRGTVHVEALCLSILGGLQPGKLNTYITKMIEGKGDDGLLQRFQLLVYPEVSTEWVNIDRPPNNVARENIDQILQKIAMMRKNPAIDLRFNDEAQKIFDHWRTRLEKRLRSDQNISPFLESHLSKYRSLIPSLSAIFHIVSGNDSPNIGEKSIELAINWGIFLEGHAKKIYQETSNSEATGANLLREKILSKELVDGMKTREIQRKRWPHLCTAEQIKQAAEILEDHHWLRIVRTKTAGRASESIEINPQVFAQNPLPQGV